jgi:galactonate dehydratase
MKIDRVEHFRVKPSWMFIKLTTDDGLVGYGETGIDGSTAAAAHVLDSLQEIILGCDPRAIEQTWASLSRGASHQGGPLLYCVISGVEQALWDIKGKACGLPIHEMLGGACRDHIRVYATCGGETADDAVVQAKSFRIRGYSAIKIRMTPPRDSRVTPDFVSQSAKRIAAVREEMGPSVEIAVDFGGDFAPSESIRLIEAIEPSFPMFIEGPCSSDNVDALVRIGASTHVPIAAGGALLTRWGFRELLEKRAVAVIQPIVALVGGILEARKISAAAETYDVSIAPRNPVGPISLAASLQVAACTPNFIIQEHLGMANKRDLGLGLLKEPFVVSEGQIALPRGPGLGIEIDDEAIAESALDS